MRPLTRAPRSGCPPRCGCDRQSRWGSPPGREGNDIAVRGEDIHILVEQRLPLTLSMNSWASLRSLCHSSSCRSQVNFSSSAVTGVVARTPDSLYFQWAAIPYSAMWCISRVRICTSMGRPMAANHHRVQRLVAVGLGQADIVFKATGDGAKGIVDDRQGPIAFFVGVGHNQHGAQRHRFRGNLFAALHFAINAVEVLGAAADIHHMPSPACSMRSRRVAAT
jgi:hypothetical protein